MYIGGEDRKVCGGQSFHGGEFKVSPEGQRGGTFAKVSGEGPQGKVSREKGVGEDSCSGKRMVWGGGGPRTESDTTERLN